MKNTENFAIILCNTPNIENAKLIAHKLVKQKLVACVNIVNSITSIFEWEGKIEEETESTLIIKTLTININDIESEILSLHPYDTPEIILIKVDSSNEKYYDWLKGVIKT